jgi:hypothetical protein
MVGIRQEHEERLALGGRREAHIHELIVMVFR